MADSLGIGGDGKKGKDRGHADHLKNPLGQRHKKHQRQLLSSVRAGEEENATNQIGNVMEESRQRGRAGSEVNLCYKLPRARSQASTRLGQNKTTGKQPGKSVSMMAASSKFSRSRITDAAVRRS